MNNNSFIIRAAVVLASNNFQDFEYSEVHRVLTENKIKITVVSSKKNLIKGTFGQEVNIEHLVNDINVDDFSAVIFIGGSGALEYLNNQSALKLAVQAVAKNKILAAICIAPEILAQAGVLKGKRATVWSSAENRSSIEVLKQKMADYVEATVVVDGRIITANGPMATKKFAEKIVELLRQ